MEGDSVGKDKECVAKSLYLLQSFVGAIFVIFCVGCV